MHDVLGWMSSIAFSLSALPQVYLCWKTKKADGVSSGLLALWLTGEVTGLGYAIGMDNPPLPIITNYVLNGIGVGYIAYIKWRDQWKQWNKSSRGTSTEENSIT
jgi:uncharacterized protein with PQ loop repeat